MGKECLSLLKRINAWRTEYFQSFPYLYAGETAVPSASNSFYASRPKASIIVAKTAAGQLVGYAACSSLASMDTFEETERNQLQNKLVNLSSYYCLNDIIIKPSYRGRGLMQQGIAEFEQVARKLGFQRVCLYTVVRATDDPRRPANYQNFAEPVYQKLGYEKSVVFTLTWPTLQANGCISPNCINPVVLWEKRLI
ncbi:MAG: hypothetical protein RLZ12_763 [Bacillota bacterium]|jgi:GNAT superfamily N-acetyltransferase